MIENSDTGPSASTGASRPSDVDDLARLQAEAIVSMAKAYGQKTGVVVDRMEHEDVFPFPEYAIRKTPSDWRSTNCAIIELEYPKHAHWAGQQTVFRIGDHRVPDWMLGFMSCDRRASLPEDGTVEDIKSGLFACFGDSLMVKARAIRSLMEHYEMDAVEFVADFLTGELTFSCTTQRSCISVNGVMSNHRVRKMMIGKVTANVSTYIERGRRTDGHLGDGQPKYQEITRTFVYRDTVLVHNEPTSWSAGTTYSHGDTLYIAGQRWTSGGDITDPGSGGDEQRRFKNCAALSPGERAYAQAARNR